MPLAAHTAAVSDWEEAGLANTFTAGYAVDALDTGPAAATLIQRRAAAAGHRSSGLVDAVELEMPHQVLV